jgi:hypothetical protein
MAPGNHASVARIVWSVTVPLMLIVLLAFAFGVGAQDKPASAPISNDGRQPIAFSHRIHVADNGIQCQLCHTYARRSPVAGIPSVQRCAQCHQTIAPKKPEIVKLLAFWREKKPIQWIRVHELPDYVRFTHKRHVLAGVACETCHGDVAHMEAAVQTAPLTMGWCLSCHQQRGASTDCLVCHH